MSDAVETRRGARLRAVRARARATRVGRIAWRIGITIVGVAVIVIGVILLPLPGPGWLVIFGGLGILATEYEWAARLLRWVREQVLRWTRWAQAKPLWVRLGLGFLTFVVIAAVVIGAWFVSRRAGLWS